MFIMTLSATISMIITTVLVLTAFQINRDSSEATTYIKKAMLISLSALLIVVVTYYFCYDYTSKLNPLEWDSLRFQTCYKLLDLSDLALSPIFLCFVRYIAALVNHKPDVDRMVKKTGSIMIVLGLIQSVMVLAYMVQRLVGVDYEVCYHAVNGMDTLVVMIFTILSLQIIYLARKELGRVRIFCLSVFLLGAIVSTWVVIVTDESFLFSISASIFIFLFLAMQSERVNMSNVDSVISAQMRARELDVELQQSKDDVEREAFLLKEISNVYESLHIINVKTDTHREIGIVPDYIAILMTGELENAGSQKLLWSIMKRVNSPAFLDEALRFMDFATINERMKGKKRIAFESLSDDDYWFRFSFIRVGNDLEEELEEVLFTVEDIDSDKRERDRLEVMSYRDELTGVYNSNAYVELREKYQTSCVPKHFWLMVTDINALKFTNDTKGHSAGDELIKAAAHCLKTVVGNDGEIFRTGGDEFVTIIQGSKEEFDRLRNTVEEIRKGWTGNFSEHLYFSTGIVCSDEFPDMSFENLSKEADKRMYMDKKAFYYSHSDLDLRKQRG